MGEIESIVRNVVEVAESANGISERELAGAIQLRKFEWRKLIEVPGWRDKLRHAIDDSLVAETAIDAVELLIEEASRK